jgi:hypothetical protein
MVFNISVKVKNEVTLGRSTYSWYIQSTSNSMPRDDISISLVGYFVFHDPSNFTMPLPVKEQHRELSLLCYMQSNSVSGPQELVPLRSNPSLLSFYHVPAHFRNADSFDLCYFYQVPLVASLSTRGRPFFP